LAKAGNSGTQKGAVAADAFVGARLRALRAERSMTQEKLGEIVRLSTLQIQKYESGKTAITASRLLQFAKLFKVPVEAFFSELPDPTEGSNFPKEAEALTLFAGSVEGRELCAAIQGIRSDRTRRLILQLVQELGPRQTES